jgi:Zn-dependent M28 family amino/carboxypeptidase
VVIGAHYDSVKGSPGANDNGSGVAALLELALLLREVETTRTIRLVAFANEEAPFFFWGEMGSMLYARRARARGEDIRLMVSLETMGFFSDAPGSQRYPPFFRFFYPDRGNFIAFVSDLRSRRVLRQAVGAFRACSDFPVQHAATFGCVPGVGWSDHLSFWRQGYRALMITDTAPYRYPHYHTAEDTPDKVDYGALARLTLGLGGAFRSLADSPRL